MSEVVMVQIYSSIFTIVDLVNNNYTCITGYWDGTKQMSINDFINFTDCTFKRLWIAASSTAYNDYTNVSAPLNRKITLYKYK